MRGSFYQAPVGPAGAIDTEYIDIHRVVTRTGCPPTTGSEILGSIELSRDSAIAQGRTIGRVTGGYQVEF